MDVKEYDKDHIWYKGMQYISLSRFTEAINETKKQTEIEKTENKKIDNINHPKHYEGKIECIDAMQEVIGKVGVIDFCIGNAFKYIWRCMKKHEMPIEDLKKCRWYINKALDLLEIEGNKG